MAASLSTAIDVYLTIHQGDTKRPIFHGTPLKLNPPKRRLLSISCTSNSPPPPPPETQNGPESVGTKKKKKKNSSSSSSLATQLEPLVSDTLSSGGQKVGLLSKPKSTWVNPSKPRRSVLSPTRQTRVNSSYNPKFRELISYMAKLNECSVEDGDFVSVLEEIPPPGSADDALLVLKGLKPWERCYLYFNWIKGKGLFPMDTVMYNVAMKGLRYGKKFELIEGLANEMISTGVELDNITYSTIITCAIRRERFDKAVEWFERMYRTGLMPDEVTYCTVLDVYARLVKVEDAMSLYDRGIASGWKPDVVAYSILARMFGDAGDPKGIWYVLTEMKSRGVEPNLPVYNTMLEGLGKARKPGHAMRLFEEMVAAGVRPNPRTLTALAKIYGKARWSRSAMELQERIKSNDWPTDFLLNNTLISVCADLGLVEEAEQLFNDLKGSTRWNPDSSCHSAMLKVYSQAGNADKALAMFEEMCEHDIKLNVMGYTSLIRTLGKAGKVDDLVRVFDAAIESGIRPDDRLNGCLLSVLPLCELSEEADKVLSCLQKSNPKVVAFIKSMEDEKTSFGTVKGEFKVMMSSTVAESRRPFCNSLIDISRNKNLNTRAYELLYLGTLYGLYPDLHSRTAREWSLDVRSLSAGAALTALEDWLVTLTKFVQRKEALPELFSAYTGNGTHSLACGLGKVFTSHMEELGAPFKQNEENAGVFLATRDDLVAWIQSASPSHMAASRVNV